MILLLPDLLADWTSGRWVGPKISEIRGVCHDTRSVAPGQLYVAIHGERFDGHQFVNEAFERGASAAMVAKPFAEQWPGRSLLVVADPKKALADMARGYRRSLPANIVAVTGSVGKTTVKEMAADILACKGPTARSLGNWNNQIGLPLSLMSMERDDEFGVFEVGISRPGEMGVLAELLRPNSGIMTEIGPVHQEFFVSTEAIAREKSLLLNSLPPNGLAFLSSDDAWYHILAEAASCPVVTVSMNKDADADFVGQARECTGELEVREKDAGKSSVYPMPLLGDHIMRNALLAIAAGRKAGVSPELIATALRNYAPPPMRWNKLSRYGVVVINDAYNANPVSMRAALRTFASEATAGRKWIVLGGMRELGVTEREEHLVLGQELARGSWCGVVTVGMLGKVIAEGAVAAGWPPERIKNCSDTQDAAMCLQGQVGSGDMVLLKGSRAEKLEQILDYWQ